MSLRSPRVVALSLMTLVSVTAMGCAANNDARSRELLSISHLSGPPVASLALSDDRSFEFNDSSREVIVTGTLEQADFDTLSNSLSREALDSLYSERESDESVCTSDSEGYVLSTQVGAGCFVARNIMDSTSRGVLESIVALFERIAASAQ